MTEKESLIALTAYIPFGPARIKLLLDYFGSAKKSWNANERDIRQIGLGEERAIGFLRYRHHFDASEYFNRLKKLKIDVIAFNEKLYPENLKDLANSPVALYIKGKIKLVDTSAIAIVGSRKMTSYGREVTTKFASELAGYGITIVSGLARGIDTAAHKGALGVGGRTIAVLGCGLDSVYPPENFRLAEEIIGSGAIISEYPLGYPAKPINFASRNRIISGLSRAVIVVEGAEKSGTLLTASCAAEQGRTVFAVPGQITSPLSAAPHFLLKNGARMITSTKDILEELNIQTIVNREEVERVMPSDKDEAAVLEILENESLHLDEIVRMSSLDIGKLSARLTVMELKGLIRNLGGGVYKKI